MAAAVLVPCLVQLRTELDALNPDRDRASDGWIGDAAHQARVSDHNDDESGAVPIHDADTMHEVHALDVDPDGLPMDEIVAGILARCRSGAEDRLRYIIWWGWIYEASNGWKQRAYTRSDNHHGHAHFSASYTTKYEADTSPWLTEVPLLTDADKAWLTGQIKAQVIAALKTDGVVTAPPSAASVKTNPSWAATSALTDACERIRQVEGKVDTIVAAVKPAA
ncbi:hypothetical protein [Actinoplanes sp. NPDC051851]|uniref:hypothetical protein n=1 Tax=Actinoplanes sp. NPDC051851 TaxID=3154753 RepID=UPI003449776B